MNVCQYFTIQTGRAPHADFNNFMGDDMPIDSNCGHACARVIDACQELINYDGDKYDCDARFEFLGHIVSAFGYNCDELQEFENADNEGIIALTETICSCYIYG